MQMGQGLRSAWGLDPLGLSKSILISRYDLDADIKKRCIHYGATPSSTNDRFAACKSTVSVRDLVTCLTRPDVCFKPAAFVSEETKQKRLEVFEKKQGTAHDPAILRVTPRLPPEDHPSYADAVSRPLQQPVLSRRAKQLAGLVPY